MRPADPPVQGTLSWVRNPIDLFRSRATRTGGTHTVARGRPRPPAAPCQLRPDRPAAHARGTRRIPRRPLRRTPTRKRWTGCSPRRATASAWPSTGSTPLATPTRTATRWIRQKEMWPWRDWVINAFNRNLPYDRFTIEQLAGDLLPNATLDQKIATGFQRNHRINSETGSIAEEFHAENLVDRVSTTRHRLAGPDRRLRPLPRSQVRSALHARVLQPLRLLQQRGRSGQRWPTRRPRQLTSRTCACPRRN